VTVTHKSKEKEKKKKEEQEEGSQIFLVSHVPHLPLYPPPLILSNIPHSLWPAITHFLYFSFSFSHKHNKHSSPTGVPSSPPSPPLFF